MKKIKFYLALSVFLITLVISRQGFTQGFRFSEGFAIDSDFTLYELDPATWYWHKRIGDVIAVDGSYYTTATGSIATFIIKKSGFVYQHGRGNWIRIYGCINALDVASYDLDSTYVIQKNSKTIYKYNPNWNGFDWHSDFPGDNPKIVEVDEQGTPLVATVMGDIYKYVNNTWVRIHRSYRSPLNYNELEFYTHDIGANAGEIYAAGRYGPVNTTQLYRYNGTSFEKAGLDRVLKVDIDRDGTVYVVTQHTYELLFKPAHSNKFFKVDQFNKKYIIDIGM